MGLMFEDAAAMFFALLGNSPTIPRPWYRAQPVRRNAPTGFLAEAIHAIADALQRAVYFEESIVLRPKFRPEQITVELLLGGVGDVDTQHFRWGGRFLCALGVSMRQSIAEVKQGVIVPIPLGRDVFEAIGVWRVGLRLVLLRWEIAALGGRERDAHSSWLHDGQFYVSRSELLRDVWQSVLGSCSPARPFDGTRGKPAEVAGKKCEGYRRECSAEHRDRCENPTQQTTPPLNVGAEEQ